MMKRTLLAAASYALALCLYAQLISAADNGFIDRGVMMYADGNYFGCIDQLTKVVDYATLTDDEVEKLLAYKAMATVHTAPLSAISLLNDFIASYPGSKYIPKVLLSLGDCYYGHDFGQALEIYQMIDVRTLDEADSDDLRYRSAYSYMMLQDYDEAIAGFDSLAGSPKYGEAALFYRGYIAYVRRYYGQAEQLFKGVSQNTAPGNMAEYYLSQIYFMRDDYSRALSTAKSLLKRDGIQAQYMTEAYRIAGESAYHLGDENQAISYLRQYVDATESPLPSTLLILGINAYEHANYSQALEYLTDVTHCDDAMGQCAYLYMGQSYLHQDDYDAAAMALNRALNMSYDPEIRETAYYNYAVASMHGGKAPFASTVKIFSDFLKYYPHSRYAAEVQDYIITSYLTDNNYEAALNSINQMADPSSATLAAKQRILYVLGTKALGVSNYAQALTYLNDARQLSKYDKDIDSEVSLSLGEAYYGLGKYTESAKEIQNYLNKAPKSAVNRSLAAYDLGYALFAQKKYAQAATQFSNFLKSDSQFPATFVADAYNRLGDCYYFEKDFGKAVGEYDAAYQRNPSAGDYSLFQKALMAGYLRDYNSKIDILKRLQKEFPTSALIPDALLETTESYIQLDKSNEAIDVYGLLVKTYPNTAQARQGYLQMALVKLNKGNRSSAIADYKKLISNYPTSEEAQQAVDQMKRIAAEDGTLSSFMAFLKETDRAPQLDQSEIEQLTYDNAEKEFVTFGKMEKLESFVEDYPESNMRAKALSYLAEGKFTKGDDDAAYDYASALVNQYPSSNYTQKAYLIKAQIEESQGKGNLALRTWKELANIASTTSNLHSARMGVIRNGRNAEAYDDVINAAESVIATSGVGAEDLNEAIFSRGWAMYRRGNSNEARNEWEKIADTTDSNFGIQSAFYLGQMAFDAKNYIQAEKWAKKVANADSPHAYWIARGFILLSDVYKSQGDTYKARQYLEAVRDNYMGSESDIFEMIDQRLK